MNKSILIPVLALLLAAAVLFGANAGLSSVRAENTQAEHVSTMLKLLPGSEDFVLEPYTGEDANIRSVHKAENGYVIEAATAGYAGEIVMLVGVNNDGHVTGLQVRDMEETYGLGMNGMFDHVFLAQFLNTSGEAEVGTNVDAITGATVTSKAITRGVNSAIAVVTGADAASSATTWGG